MVILPYRAVFRDKHIILLVRHGDIWYFLGLELRLDVEVLEYSKDTFVRQAQRS